MDESSHHGIHSATLFSISSIKTATRGMSKASPTIVSLTTEVAANGRCSA
jgi:hypothetical protein